MDCERILMEVGCERVGFNFEKRDGCGRGGTHFL